MVFLHHFNNARQRGVKPGGRHPGRGWHQLWTFPEENKTIFAPDGTGSGKVTGQPEGPQVCVDFSSTWFCSEMQRHQ